MATLVQSIILAVFISLLVNSLHGFISVGRKAAEKMRIPIRRRFKDMLDVYEKMNGVADILRYILSAWCSPFDIFRTNGGYNKRRFTVLDERGRDHFPGRYSILVLGISAIAIIVLQIIAGGWAVDVLVEKRIVTQTSLSDMDLIKFGEGGRAIENRECTLNGILIDQGTRVENDIVRRQEVRLDAFGTYVVDGIASIVNNPFQQVYAEVKQDPLLKEIYIWLRNAERNFSFGLTVRASVTGLDGVAHSYNLYDGVYENNPGIKKRLKEVAGLLGINTIGEVDYKFAAYIVGLDATFVELQTIVEKMTSLYCDMFTVGKIDNNENNVVQIPTSQTTEEKFPNWFWIVFSILCCISVVTTCCSLLEFNDTEKLIILGKDVRGRNFCLASPITELSQEVELGFSNTSVHGYLQYGHLVDRDYARINKGQDYTIGKRCDLAEMLQGGIEIAENGACPSLHQERSAETLQGGVEMAKAAAFSSPHQDLMTTEESTKGAEDEQAELKEVEREDEVDDEKDPE